MERLSRSEAITYFMRHSTSPIAKLYTRDMEVQVQVAQDDGERYQGKTNGISWHGFKKGGDVWKNFRMPLHANSNTPKRNDSNMFFDLDQHVEGIGMTGWDFANQETRWVGYDFDSIVNHKAGISQEDLDELINKCTQVEGLSILRSTSGNGYHIYLFFDKPIKTMNHDEHAAVARSLLSVLTVETGFDFQAKVDCVGSILWCWHRKSEGTKGLSWLKESGTFPADLLPKNWKDHIDVVKGKSKRTKLGGDLTNLASSITEVTLDASHRVLLQYLSRKSDNVFYWDSDHHLLVASTLDLLKAKKELKLIGLFDTDSSGSSEYNCFAYPLNDGGWVVRRFGKNVTEHSSWAVDETGWTKTFLNVKPTFERSCRFFSGIENRKGGFEFESLDLCAKALGYIDLDFGYNTEMARSFGERFVVVEYDKKKSKVFIVINKNSDDRRMVGWISGKNTWEKVLRYSESVEDSANLNINIDEWVRNTVSGDESAGWFVSTNGVWVQQDAGSVASVLCHLIPEGTSNELKQITGKAILNPWNFDNTPFEDEYPGGRTWNRQGAKLAFTPRQGMTPTWDDLFNHVGKALTEAVLDSSWCKSRGLYTGGDYLRMWLASVLQKPEQQLPYLFFTGEQKTGKTTFHEAIEMLFLEGRGYQFADSALKNPSGFNSELYGSVICVVEEIDLSASKTAYNRLKDWVTAEYFAINTKYKNIFKSRNYMHWIQTANSPRNVPVFEGDTRVVVTQVYRLSKEIPKKLLKKQLMEEAPAMLFNMLALDVGKPEGRLGLPVLETALKTSIMESNFTPIDRFINEECTIVKGVSTALTDFHIELRKFLIDNDYVKELKTYELLKIRSLFPERGILRIGINDNNVTVVSNLVMNKIGEGMIDSLISEDKKPLMLNERGVIC